MMPLSAEWLKNTGANAEFLRNERESVLASYEARPELLEEHFNLEDHIRTGAYATKQINELVQNAADPMEGLEGKIEILLTPNYLYCANEGMPFNVKNIQALQTAYSSSKSGNDIGRFGLGFKSLLAISDSPEIFTSSGSFAFDNEQFEADLAARGLSTEKTPKLRLAYAINAKQAIAEDADLARMVQWASTVIRVPLTKSFDFLHKEIEDFKAQFLLFSDKVGSLDLKVTVPGHENHRTFTRTPHPVRDYEFTINIDGDDTVWRVFTAEHRPSAKALAGVSGNTAKSTLPVTWAVQVGGKRAGGRTLGEFWQYFPTAQKTGVPGIFNAAFDMSPDRANIGEGSLFNEEIIQRTIPQLVAANLPLVHNEDEPGKTLDLYPSAEDGGGRSWAEKLLRAPLYAALAQVPSVPAQDGKLYTPQQLNLPLSPKALREPENETLLQSFYEEVQKHPDIHSSWVHASAATNSTRHRILTEIFSLANNKVSSIREMLSAFAQKDSIDMTISAIKFSHTINHNGTADQIAEMRNTKFLWDGYKNIRPPKVSELSITNSLENIEGNPGQYIHPDLCNNKECSVLLKDLGFRIQSGLVKFSRALKALQKNTTDPNLVADAWRATIFLEEPVDELIREIHHYFPDGTFPALCMDGSIKPVNKTWLHGGLIQGEREEDLHLLLNLNRLGNVAKLAATLGAHRNLNNPVLQNKNDETYKWWASQGFKDYCRTLNNLDGLPGVFPHNLKVPNQFLTPGLQLLNSASQPTRAKVTLKALEGSIDGLTPGHPVEDLSTCTQLPTPNLYWILKYGVAETNKGIRDASEIIKPPAGFPEELLAIPLDGDLREALYSHNNQKFTLETVMRELHRNDDLAIIHRGYSLLAELTELSASGSIYFSAITLQGAKPMPASKIYVVLNEDAKNHILTHHSGYGVIISHSAGAARIMQNRFGMQFADIDFVTTIETHGIKPKGKIKDYYPHLSDIKEFAKTWSLSKIRVSECSLISKSVQNTFDQHTEKKNVNCIYDTETKTVYYTPGISSFQILQVALKGLKLEYNAADLFKRHQQLAKSKNHEKRINDVKNAADINEKLTEMLGEEKLRNIMPDEILDIIESVTGETLSTHQYGTILESIHGVDLLKALKPYLQEVFRDNTPMQFAGGAKARKFVDELNLDKAFAGERNIRMPDQEFFTGPVRLPPLHDYQLDVSSKIIEMLSQATPQKGFISLPTGSGKTRVATESIVRFCEVSDKPHLIVWIAGSNELCEQAVQSWQTVWQCFGKTNGQLAISRLWDSRRPVEAKDADLQVVVATFQTLSRLVEEEIYEWLFDAQILVVDEAHGAVAKSFTSIFQKFGRSPRDKTPRGHLLGLSATPYRGYNAEETEQLATRFDRNLYEPIQFAESGAHEYLQEIEVLSEVDYDVIDGIKLEKKALSETQKRAATDEDLHNRMNRMAEMSLDLEQIASSQERNVQLVEHIKGLVAKKPESSIILFAASVKHAVALAAVLNFMQISAASVSGSSSPAARKRAIAGFKSGEYKVLTNYGVLSEGFDAPKCDAVYIARPVFSPNRYLQMIGRGLRGPKNGGSKTTLIVNVRDNTDNFEQKLAFDELKEAWLEPKK